MKCKFQLCWNTECSVRLYRQYWSAGEVRVITSIYKGKTRRKELLTGIKHTAVDETRSSNEDYNISQHPLSCSNRWQNPPYLSSLLTLTETRWKAILLFSLHCSTTPQFCFSMVILSMLSCFSFMVAKKDTSWSLSDCRARMVSSAASRWGLPTLLK